MPRCSASFAAESSAISVRTQPGSTALDVTPCGPPSCARPRMRPSSPALDAQYALIAGPLASTPAVELTKTQRPWDPATMSGSAARQSMNGASRLTAIVHRQTSGSCSHTTPSAALPAPALLTSTEIGPRRARVSCTIRSHSPGPVRSPTTYSRPVERSSSSLRAVAITRRPRSARSSAVARPMPRPAPVTSATRSDEVTGNAPRPRPLADDLTMLASFQAVLEREARGIAGHAAARLDAQLVISALVLDRLEAVHLGRQRIALDDRVDGLVLGQLAHAVRVHDVPSGVPQEPQLAAAG